MDWYKPRRSALAYMADHDVMSLEPLAKADFDAKVDAGEFIDGPFADQPNPGYPQSVLYRPYRQAFGKLWGGAHVITELHPEAPPPEPTV